MDGEDIFTCPVCAHIIWDDTILQCLNGHCFCATCVGRLTECALWRIPVAPDRLAKNLVLRQARDTFLFTCGVCKQGVAGATYREHPDVCGVEPCPECHATVPRSQARFHNPRWCAAAARGEPEAQCRMGHWCYEVVGDAAAAERWYERAAAQGYAKGQNSLAVLLGVTPRAVDLLTRAAEQGYVPAFHNLGMLRERSDLAEARRWFERAAQKGCQHSAARLAYLNAVVKGAGPPGSPQRGDSKARD